jgi:SAM-dependent methyltransferase
VSRRSIERLGLRAGERVLDVPCGTGAALVTAAHAVGAGGGVVGLDYASRMVAIAREQVAASGLENVTVDVGDMLAIPPPAIPFDAVACSLGVFFADDMARFVRSLVGLVKQETGRIIVSVFGECFFEPMRTVFVDAVKAVAPGVPVVEPWRRTEREAVLRALFRGSAQDVSIITDEDRLSLRGAADWWRIVMGSGFRSTVERLSTPAAAEVRARCEAFVATHGVVELTSTTRYALASFTATSRP